MDAETLYTATKWEMLKLLEERPHSPIEIAERLGSSLANVSQQLRLLEMAGLVTSRRVSNRDKGQPRVLYQLAGNLSYLIATSDGFVDKKAVRLSERNKVSLRIWFIEDAALRYALEKAFWAIEDHLDSIGRIAYAGLEQGVPVLEVKGGKPPAQVAVGGVFGNVRIRAAAQPKGVLLYAKE